MKIERSIYVFKKNSKDDSIQEEFILTNLNIEDIIDYFNIEFEDEDTGVVYSDIDMIFVYNLSPSHEPIFSILYPNLLFDFNKYDYQLNSHIIEYE